MTEIVLPPMLRSRRVRLDLITTGAGLCLGLLAPFGSYLNSGLIWRLLYWCGSIWFGLLLFGGMWCAWQRYASRLQQARWSVLVAMFVVASLVQASITRITAFLIWPELHRSAPAWGIWYLQSGLITAVGFALFFLLRLRSTPSTLPTAGGATVMGRPVRAIPSGKEVLALQMEDHYVRIHTRTGSQLMQMTLTEAMDAVGSIEGMRTHRSWWVARGAVKRIEGSPRAMRLHLEGDIVAPVARGTVAVLREAGWLKAVE
ncbi:MAG: LytTR family DNA-binding domain-containing protein [Acetobacter malorum]